MNEFSSQYSSNGLCIVFPYPNRKKSHVIAHDSGDKPNL